MICELEGMTDRVLFYPSLNRISRLYPNPHILLGKEIYWEEKRDGSNIGAYLNDNDELCFRSRHREVAGEGLVASIGVTDHTESILEYLADSRHQWDSNDIIFFELLQKGKSPTKTEYHETAEIAVFDIYTSKNGWLNYTSVYQKCYQYKLPMVRLFGKSNHTTMESLLEFRDEMLELCKTEQREGVVGKVWQSGELIMFKEKLDIPDLQQVRQHHDEGEVLLPPLPLSEIMGAIEKVRIDLGDDQFRDVRTAMPLVMQYINEESKKHNCARVKNGFQYYKQRLEEI